MTAVVQQQTFEQRLMGRIKDSIGELMTEEDLKKIVERGIEEALFKERVVSTDSYGRREMKQPLVQEVIERFLTAHVRDAVDRWIADNQDKILPAVKEVIQAGAGQALLNAIEQKFRYDFQQMGQNIISKLAQR